jgi:Cdc6-like AAA superfamily ATPase
MDEEMEKNIKDWGCPSIAEALPPWPSQAKNKASWIELQERDYIFTHQCSYAERVEDAKNDKNKKSDEKITETLFCIPIRESQRLLSILKESEGGSILVTGYRGAGKSSLVNYTVSKLINEEKKKYEKFEDNLDYVPIRINLSTSRTPMALMNMMIKELFHCWENKRFHPKLKCIRRKRSWIRQKLNWIFLIPTRICLIIKWIFPKIECSCPYAKGIDSISKVYKKFVVQTVRERTVSIGAAGETGNFMGGANVYKKSIAKDLPYTLHEAQQDLHRCLKGLNKNGKKIIFIFDELDKLTPQKEDDTNGPQKTTLLEVQTIVADLKFLLTEANAFHIFIAGKDVDDSWQEDQNKGEGRFESTFVQNVYLPSALTVSLKAAASPHQWIEKSHNLWINLLYEYKNNPNTGINCCKKVLKEDYKNLPAAKDKKFQEFREKFPNNFTDRVYTVILNELGITDKTWTYNTGLLVLPYLSTNELYRLLLRYGMRKRRDEGSGKFFETLLTFLEETGEKIKDNTFEPKVDDWVTFIDLLGRINHEDTPHDKTSKDNKNQFLEKLKKSFKEYLKDNIPLTVVDPMGERETVLIRHVLQYLTYKGRGIPRKILREFYEIVQHHDVIKKNDDYREKRGDGDQVIYIPTMLHHKINFFANIVKLLESSQGAFRYLGDKGRVATFHFIDYILKFYQTGFTWADIEGASFMTQRTEIFPSRELAAVILEILEDHLIIRLDRRLKVYDLLPQVKHNLERLYLAFGPEQIELRFTKADFATELEQLHNKVQKVEKTTSDQRLESSRAQIRIAKLYEHLGDLQEARHGYSKAFRWMQNDINRIMSFDSEYKSTFNINTITTYLSIGIDTLQRLGYLFELIIDFDTALHYYQLAVRLFESIWKFDEKETKGILGKRMQPLFTHTKRKSPRTPPGSYQKQLDELIKNMVPFDKDEQKPFTNEQLIEGTDFIHFEIDPYPVYSAFEPTGYPVIINIIAIVMEKKWHRFASNRFLLLALDFYRRQLDEHQIIDQMIFIGEVLMRRRDIRQAASWYLLTLDRLVSYQKCDQKNLFSKQAGVHRTTRAKLFEYLGDIYFATDGTALLDKKELRYIKGIDDKISDKMTDIRKKLILGMMDYRDEEYFYTQATYHYGINQQPLRECDVYMKRMNVRITNLFKTLQKNDFKIEDIYGSPDLGNAVRAWCTFWFGAEKILNALLDSLPNDNRTQSFEKGKIVDRRRFGKLLTLVGRMFMMASERELIDWYLDSKVIYDKHIKSNGKIEEEHDDIILKMKKEIPKSITNKSVTEKYLENELKTLLQKRKDITKTALGIDRVIGLLIDNEDFKKGLAPPRDKKIRNIFKKNGIRERSCLFRLAPKSCKETKNGQGDKEECRWPEEAPNAFLVGQLYLICGHMEFGISEEQRKEEVEKIKKKIILLYLAEISLLGAHISFKDSLKSLSSARTGQKLGILYLQCIEHLLTLREYVSCNRFDEKLANVYTSLHLASKRFLANAIDNYLAERYHARCTHTELGLTYRALGELLLIRAEILECCDSDKKNSKPENRQTTFSGIRCPWSRINEYIKLQKEHIADNVVDKVRYKAGEAYRNACRQYLMEIEDYTKRYRLSNEVYFLQKNIMDSEMHFEICQSIYMRHWDYKTKTDVNGRMAALALTEMARKLSVELFRPAHRVRDRKVWLKDIKVIVNLVSKLSPNQNYIDISEKEKEYSVSWIKKQEKKEEEKSFEDIARNFFRSYDDGLTEN